MIDERTVKQEYVEKFKQEWALVTKLVRLNAGRRGKDLKEILIVEKR